MAERHLEDRARLHSLAETGLLDAPERISLQRYARIACKALGAPVGLVSLVDAERQFFAGAHGLDMPWSARRQTPLSHSFCQHVVDQRSPLVVGDARNDERVCDSLAVDELNVSAYAGVPLRDPEGNVLGSFCVLDTQPREWTTTELQVLESLAAAVAEELELCRRTWVAERAEAELAEVNQEIAEAHQRAADHNAAVMHDLRTPLQVIAMAVRGFEDHPAVRESDALRKSVEMMQRNVRQALKLLRNGGRQPAGDELFERLDLARFVERVCTDLATGSSVDVDLDLEAAEVLADPMMIRRALQNLVTNALRFAAGRVRVTVGRQRELVLIAVEDDGDGLPREEDYERVWELGRRFHGTRSNTGLGLAVTRQLIQALGGRVRARPSALGGARFELWLPEARGGQAAASDV